MTVPSQLRRVASVALLLAAPILANEKPDTPAPKIEAKAPKPAVRGAAPFWTRSTKAEGWTLAGVAVFDGAQTCHNLATGGREVWLHTRTCGGAVGRMAAWDVGIIGAAWILHRAHHDKLARVPMLFQIEEHTRAIIYSKEHHAW